MPPLAEAAVKVVFGGTMNGSQDWSTGLWFITAPTDAAISPAEATTIANDCETALEPFWNGAASAVNLASTVLNFISVYGYNTASQNSYVVGHAQGFPSRPGTGGSPVPFFTSLVTSLRTGIGGRSYRGRVYLPTTALPLAPDGHTTKAVCDSLNTGWKTLINALSAQLVAGGLPLATPAVASFTKGLLTPITSLITNDIPDTQHRREDKLGIQYEAEATL